MRTGRLVVLVLLAAVAASIASGQRRRVQEWAPEPEIDALRERMESARAALLHR